MNKIKGVIGMKFKKRKLTVLTAFVCAIAMLTGCAGTPDSTGTNDAPAANTPTENVSAENTTSDDTASAGGLHVLTLEDVQEMYNPDASTYCQDESMAEPVASGSLDDLAITDAEKETIRGMNLKVGIEMDHLDDAMKLIQQGVRDQCEEYGINLADIWMAEDQTGASTGQRADYQNFLAIADEYDGFFTGLTNSQTNSDILQEIMQKTKVGTWIGTPFGIDWNDPNWIGMSDTNQAEIGLQSAMAAVKLIGESGGSIGTVSSINGKTGRINSVYQHVLGWDKVFAEHPEITVHQAWFDTPADSKTTTASLLASNPDIKVLMVDWAYPPGDDALQVLQELGLKAGEDIYMLTIDYDNVATIPMASYGNDGYVAAIAATRFYEAGANMVRMFVRNILDEGNNVKYFAVNPPPIVTPMNVKTIFRVIVPETVDAIPFPEQIEALTEQWTLEEMGAGALAAD
jgi:ABC-type sugar transport system substrate-binding protein